MIQKRRKKLWMGEEKYMPDIGKMTLSEKQGAASALKRCERSKETQKKTYTCMKIS